MFDYLSNERKLTNLVWVYSAALTADDLKEHAAAVETRKRYYPGDQHVDIAGIDMYPNDGWGWKHYRSDTYAKAFETMSQVAPGKMLALCECGGFPDPELLAKQGPKWPYCLPWWVGNDDDHNPPAWVKSVYPHELLITRERLPKWKQFQSSPAGTGPRTADPQLTNPNADTPPTARPPGYPIRFAPSARVTINDSFCRPILERNRTVILPHILKLCEETGLFRNFDRAAGQLDGLPEGTISRRCPPQERPNRRRPSKDLPSYNKRMNRPRPFPNPRNDYETHRHHPRRCIVDTVDLRR